MTPDAPPRRRWLALVFPWLPVERLRSTRPHLFVERGETPVALIETAAGAVRLTALDRSATLLGLAPGMTLADARAQVPELETFAADAHADHAWLERLADGCARYTPTVTLRPPDALLLDIAGCTHAFEGEGPLAADVEARMARQGVLIRQAFGDTPDIALALARHAGMPAPDEARAVRRLPVAALELEAEDAAALARAGLKTVGDVMTQPLATIAARFGEEAASAVRRLSGEARAPVTARAKAAPVFVERRFAEPIARADHALEVLAELAGTAATTLETRREGGRRWRARLYRSDGQVHELRVETGAPTRDGALLGRLFRERIDALVDPLDPGFGYDMVRLDVMLAERIGAGQLKLEGGAARDNRGEKGAGEAAALVDRPSTRPGRRQVRRFAARDGHLPEQAELALPAAQPAAARPVGRPALDEPPLRPIHLFDPPQPIELVMAEVPDGPPRRFRWRRTLHEVARAEGPERIAGEWWRRHDAAIPMRDYYRVEDHRGRRLWIFRHGLFSETDDPRWYVHGLFA